MVPSIPADLVYHVLDCLWSDPWALLNCALTCRTWRDASRRLLRRGRGLEINDSENLDRVSRLVNSRKTRHFFQNLEHLYIGDDKEKPFMHVLPLRLPGMLFPRVRILRLAQIDWATRRPHASTFILATSFASVVDLNISNSRFGTLADCRQLVSAFRNVDVLELDAITILTSSAGPRYLDLAKGPRCPVKWLRLEALRLDVIPEQNSTGAGQFLNPVLELCSSFALVTMLHIRKCTFRTFDDIRRFICWFPLLRNLKLMDIVWESPGPRRSTLPFVNEVPGIPRSLDTLVASVASPAHGDRLLEWLATSLPNGALIKLAVDSMVRHMTFTYLTEAHTLQIRIDVQRDTPDLQLSRLAMLQGLEEFGTIGVVVRRIDFLINKESRTFYTSEVPSAVSLGRKTSGSATARPAFASVERVAVDLGHYPSLIGTERSTLREARDEIRHLLSRWDDRGILTFSYPIWYSDAERSIGELDSADSGTDVDDWDIWRDET
ncbi:hypothetical protein DAEQUDRAFT_765054 [Daedalea quercina L-15889]|uniref:F-box domain-containing protein n=1 Tax=Daedalea quercina L-15889 TaxID=1314783 RepID=A0A165QWM3_9APHY|nr:hypothetical protein DAEQUDRAFT_765054 [Daedalea quercina L-15889]